MNTSVNRIYLFLVAMVAALGGFLFGFDTAVISGTIPYLQPHFSLSDFQVGLAVSSILVGCMVGVFAAGRPGDVFGRRPLLGIAALLFVISAVGTALATSLWMFVIFRFAGGLAVGAASMVSPMYIAEISPAKKRGALVSLNQMAIVIGILIAFFSNYLLSGTGIHNWRYMLGVEALPAVFFFVALQFVPESPRWLVMKKRDAEAYRILSTINGGEKAKSELKDIEESLSVKEEASYGELFRGRIKSFLFIGIILAVFQQITGINTIMYYAPVIFQKTGLGTDTALLQTIAVGGINFLFTLVAIKYIDSIGRKPLLIYGATGMTVALAGLSIAFFLERFEGYLVLFFILLFIASFASSMGPVVWVVVSEIFPNRLRSKAVSLSVEALWFACFIVALTFPVLLSSLGGGYTFVLFTIICILNLLFVVRFVPETKGKSLEEIERGLLG
jgi:MFS transporter, SP family, arabinose:H+ symporter